MICQTGVTRWSLDRHEDQHQHNMREDQLKKFKIHIENTALMFAEGGTR